MPLKNETKEILSNLLSALSIEIETIKGNRKEQYVNAKNGHLIENIGNLFIYKFTLEDVFDIPDDTDVIIKMDGNSYKSIVVNCNGLELILSCEHDLGDNVSITILISNANLLESLKKLLIDIQSENISINEDLILKLFGIIEPEENKFSEFFVPILPFELDEYQKNVINKSLNSEVSFIWGPPGTGKTAIIAILTKIIIDAGLSVLITSNTNVAVDNAFEKFIKFFNETSGDLLNGKIIRYGNIQVESIKELVQESNIILRLAAPLYKKISDLKKELENFNNKKFALEESIKEFKRYESFNKNLKQNQKYLSNSLIELSKNIEELKSTKTSLLSNQNQLSQLENLLTLSRSTNSVIRFFKGIKPPKVIINKISQTNSILNKLSIDQSKISNSIQSLKNQSAQIKIKVDNLNSDIKELENKYPEFKSFSIKLINETIKQIDNNITNINKAVTELNEEIETIEKNLINEAKVLGTTLSMFHSQSKLYFRNYEVVIIDEVTMSILPQIFFASSFAKSRIFIVGDFYQLQSIVKTRDNKIVNDWFKKDIFRKNNITDGTNPKLNKLCIQRRMNPAIAEISNKCLYNSILQHSPVDSILENEAPVSFYDTSGFSPYATVPGNTGRINIYNAVLAIKLAQKYFDNNSIKEIGIISPYRKQANILAKLIREAGLISKATADTVHKFQGLEKDLIIFDITDGINSRNFPLGAHLRDINEGPYLFNVSFTRAKKKLIIIGDLNYLRNNMNQFPRKVCSMFNIILGNNDSNYEIIDSRNILDAITIQNDPNLQIIITQGTNIIHFTEQTFYHDFHNEISKCNNTLKIYSPFIASNRIRNDLNDAFFQRLLSKKVKIKILTRPSRKHPNPNFANACMTRWRTFGINIQIVDDMHEKIAIIDNRVIYIGSLNILSQWQSSETMLKILGEDSIKELLKIYR